MRNEPLYNLSDKTWRITYFIHGRGPYSMTSPNEGYIRGYFEYYDTAPYISELRLQYSEPKWIDAA